ncbi:MAG: non-heme iron oxygenase ferredoxin subunit [Anaerolineales bacterium]|nr:non-heme iron oxygenase ferredoxin subunit [Anaerolineales bacterium]
MFNYRKKSPQEVEFYEVADQADLSNGERLFIEIDGKPIVVFNIAGNIYAVGDVCTHDDGPLGDGDLEDHNIVCPRHGAAFDVRTGKAVQMPAVVDIPAYPVRVLDGKIEIGLPK